MAEAIPVELDMSPAPGVEVQGDTETGAVGTAIIWLSPGVPRSVAPSGMTEPTVDPVSPIVDPLELEADEELDAARRG